MRYAAAYVLAALAGNATPDVSAISKILGSVGIECDKTKAQKVVDSCKGKSVEQIIEEGTKKLSSLPAAGAAAAPSAAAPAAAAADAKKGAAKPEAKKEEKKEDSEGEGDDMVSARTFANGAKRHTDLFILLFRALAYSIRDQGEKHQYNRHFTCIRQIHIIIPRTRDVCFLLMCVCVFCIDLWK